MCCVSPVCVAVFLHLIDGAESRFRLYAYARSLLCGASRPFWRGGWTQKSTDSGPGSEKGTPKKRKSTAPRVLCASFVCVTMFLRAEIGDPRCVVSPLPVWLCSFLHLVDGARRVSALCVRALAAVWGFSSLVAWG